MALPGVIIAATLALRVGAYHLLYGVGRALSCERLVRFLRRNLCACLGFAGRTSSVWWGGSAAWNTLLCTLGAAAGSAWRRVSDRVSWVNDVVMYVLLAAVVVVAIWWIVRRVIPVWRGGKPGEEGRERA